jgi:septal ring factor EnvC (AmiA/AmiB activator)
MKAFLKISLLCVLSMSTALTLGSTKSQTDKQQALQRIDQEISGVRERISQAEVEKSTLQQQLKHIDVAIGQQSKKIHHTNQQLQQQRQSLAQLQQQQREHQQQLSKHNSQLQQQMRAAYLLGREDYLKALLNQQDPGNLSRMLHYYQHFNRARLGLVHSLQQTLSEIATLEENIQQQQHELISLLEQQKQDQQHLQASKAKQSTLVQKNAHRLRDEQAHLQKLLQDQQGLQQVLRRIEQGTEQFSMGKLRGKLSLPTSGRIVEKFGVRTADNSVPNSGIVIQAKVGEAVNAVHAGKVVFADWLGGFGLLIIIDHGQGYMTLYGRNESLYREVGEAVETGDLIATVGQSGGYTKSGLYFAIRQNGKAIDPQKWIGV